MKFSFVPLALFVCFVAIFGTASGIATKRIPLSSAVSYLSSSSSSSWSSDSDHHLVARRKHGHHLSQKAKGGKGKGPDVYQVFLGVMNEDAPPTIMSNQFFPKTLTVRQGDTIRFTSIVSEVHTITFGPLDELQNHQQVPLFEIFGTYGAPSVDNVFDGTNVVNSGLISGDPDPAYYDVVINAPPGTYMFRCLIHPLMRGFVTVAARGEPKKVTADRGQRQMAEGLDHGNLFLQVVWSDLSIPVDDIFPSPAPLVQVAVGGGDGFAALYAFTPVAISVSVGTVVRYINRDPFTPHTVTVGTNTDPTDPLGMIPTPGPALIDQTTTYYNSGWLWTVAFDAVNFGFVSPSAVDLIFAEAGTYIVYCQLHDEMGMTSTVVVS